MSLAGIMFVVFCTRASADWPNFRGPNHDGISSETAFQKSWTDSIPLVWSREVGSAFSSYACVGDRVYTCGTADSMQTIYCLDADTGAVKWSRGVEDEYHEPMGGSGTRSTPTVDDGCVYVLGAKGRIVCMEAESGKELWSKRFSHMPTWGYSGSVLIEGDLAITTGGGSDGAVVAFNKKTGKQVWQCGDEPAGYATPYPFTFEGTRYVVGFSGKAAIVVEPATGREVWRKPWKTEWGVNAAAPIFSDGHLFLSSGYRTGCGVYRLRKDGDVLAGEEVWSGRVLMNKFQSCVLTEGMLYASDQRALVCVNFLTGEEKWRIHRVKHSPMFLADGHLVMLGQRGQLQIAKASAAAYSPLTSADILDGRCWSVPVLHRGKLYARNLSRLVCFDLSGSGGKTGR